MNVQVLMKQQKALQAQEEERQRAQLEADTAALAVQI